MPRLVSNRDTSRPIRRHYAVRKCCTRSRVWDTMEGFGIDLRKNNLRMLTSENIDSRRIINLDFRFGGQGGRTDATVLSFLPVSAPHPSNRQVKPMPSDFSFAASPRVAVAQSSMGYESLRGHTRGKSGQVPPGYFPHSSGKTYTLYLYLRRDFFEILQ